MFMWGSWSGEFSDDESVVSDITSCDRIGGVVGVRGGVVSVKHE